MNNNDAGKMDGRKKISGLTDSSYQTVGSQPAATNDFELAIRTPKHSTPSERQTYDFTAAQSERTRLNLFGAAARPPNPNEPPNQQHELILSTIPIEPTTIETSSFAGRNLVLNNDSNNGEYKVLSLPANSIGHEYKIFAVPGLSQSLLTAGSNHEYKILPIPDVATGQHVLSNPNLIKSNEYKILAFPDVVTGQRTLASSGLMVKSNEYKILQAALPPDHQNHQPVVDDNNGQFRLIFHQDPPKTGGTRKKAHLITNTQAPPSHSAARLPTAGVITDKDQQPLTVECLEDHDNNKAADPAVSPQRHHGTTGINTNKKKEQTQKDNATKEDPDVVDIQNPAQTTPSPPDSKASKADHHNNKHQHSTSSNSNNNHDDADPDADPKRNQQHTSRKLPILNRPPTTSMGGVVQRAKNCFLNSRKQRQEKYGKERTRMSGPGFDENLVVNDVWNRKAFRGRKFKNAAALNKCDETIVDCEHRISQLLAAKDVVSSLINEESGVKPEILSRNPGFNSPSLNNNDNGKPQGNGKKAAGRSTTTDDRIRRWKQWLREHRTWASNRRLGSGSSGSGYQLMENPYRKRFGPEFTNRHDRIVETKTLIEETVHCLRRLLEPDPRRRRAYWRQRHSLLQVAHPSPSMIPNHRMPLVRAVNSFTGSKLWCNRQQRTYMQEYAFTQYELGELTMGFQTKMIRHVLQPFTEFTEQTYPAYRAEFRQLERRRLERDHVIYIINETSSIEKLADYENALVRVSNRFDAQANATLLRLIDIERNSCRKLKLAFLDSLILENRFHQKAALKLETLLPRI